MGIGAPEVILILIVLLLAGFFSLLPLIWGYRAGSKRTIGGGVGLLLGVFLSYLGVLIVYCTQRKDEPDFYVNFPQASPADELLKYKSLWDSGAITEQEYYAQKARILNKQV